MISVVVSAVLVETKCREAAEAGPPLISNQKYSIKYIREYFEQS